VYAALQASPNTGAQVRRVRLGPLSPAEIVWDLLISGHVRGHGFPESWLAVARQRIPCLTQGTPVLTGKAIRGVVHVVGEL
jgi:hypothetical protein